MAAKTRMPHRRPRLQRHRLGQQLALCGGMALGLSGTAFALSIGQPDTSSYLTEPLMLRVPIEADHSDLRLSTVRARILPAGAYTRLGLTPPQHPLKDFKVRVLGDTTQGYWLQVTTRAGVREPILGLLIEVKDRHGSLIRHVELLLDPPSRVTTAQGQIPQPSAAREAASGPMQAALVPAPASSKPAIIETETPTSSLGSTQITPARTTPSVSATTSSPAPLAPARSIPEPPATAVTASSPSTLWISQSYGPIRAGEVLSRIAQIVRPSPDISIQKMSAALFQLNRQAFGAGPHELHAGAYLQIPGQAVLENFEGQLAWYQGEKPRPSAPVAIEPVTQQTPVAAPAAVEPAPEAKAEAAPPVRQQDPQRYRLQLSVGLNPVQTASTAQPISTTPPLLELKLQHSFSLIGLSALQAHSRPASAPPTTPEQPAPPQDGSKDAIRIQPPAADASIDSTSVAGKPNEEPASPGPVSLLVIDEPLTWWQLALLIISSLAAFFAGLIYRGHKHTHRHTPFDPDPLDEGAHAAADYSEEAYPNLRQDVRHSDSKLKADASQGPAVGGQAYADSAAPIAQNRTMDRSTHVTNLAGAVDRRKADLTQRIEYMLDARGDDPIIQHQCRSAMDFILSDDFDDAEWLLSRMEEDSPSAPATAPEADQGKGDETSDPDNDAAAESRVIHLARRQN